MIIENALDLLKNTRRCSPMTKKILSLKVGSGFTTTAKKIMGVRVAAHNKGVKIATRKMDNGHFLVCRIK